MNRGLYGQPAPLGAPARVAPEIWRNYDLITVTTSVWVVPKNVFQIYAMVWGGGAAGTDATGGGGGGGFAMGIIDVVPGQMLPTITIGAGGATSGAAGGTSSIGAILSATGGVSQGAGGEGTTEAGLRNAFTAAGGTANATASTAGAASGSPYGVGGSPTTIGAGGAAWGLQFSGSSFGASTPVSGASSGDGFLALARKGGLSGQGGTSTTAIVGIGCGSFSHSSLVNGPFPVFGGGGAGYNAGNGGKGGRGGGGGGGASGTAGFGGDGAVILFWTEGY